MKSVFKKEFQCKLGLWELEYLSRITRRWKLEAMSYKDIHGKLGDFSEEQIILTELEMWAECSSLSKFPSQFDLRILPRNKCVPKLKV